MKRSPASGQNGFSLIEIMLACAISSLLCLGIMGLAGQAIWAIRYFGSLGARELIHAELEMALKNEKALVVSKSKDPILKACFGFGPVETAACPGQTTLGVSIYDSTGTRIAGPIENPVYYTNDGAHCSGDVNQCPISVISTVRAQSVPNWQTRQFTTSPGWSRFEIVEIRYLIQYRSDQTTRDYSGSIVFETLDTWDTL